MPHGKTSFSHYRFCQLRSKSANAREPVPWHEVSCPFPGSLGPPPGAGLRREDRWAGVLTTESTRARKGMREIPPARAAHAPGVSPSRSVDGPEKGPMMVSLRLKEYSPLELIQLTRDIVAALTDNPEVPVPQPPLPVLTANADRLAAAMDAYEAALTAAAVALAQRNAALRALKASLNAEARTVDNAAQGNPAIIERAAMGVRAPRSVPQPMPPPGNLRVTYTETPGALDLRWDTVPRVRNYTIELTTDPDAAGGWTPLPDKPTQAHWRVSGLVSGQRYWFRVRANGVKGVSPAGDPVCRMAP